MIRACIGVLLAGVSAFCSLAGTDPPPPEFFQVLKQPLSSGPRITPYLRYQTEQAWKEDEARQKAWEAIRDEAGLHKAQDDLRQKLLQMIGGLPTVKSDLHAEITGKIPMDGFIIEKLVFQSLPGIYVTALVYVPKDHQSKHPAVLVPAGHAADGKFHYQALSQRLAGRGYVVISWDPVGQGERSQFWDSKAQKSRYNLICAEHAVMGNLAYLAGANLARWEVWDGIRAVDYLLTRPDVDGERISITGTSGGGTQTALIAALDPRIKVAVPSCFITALPMRMSINKARHHYAPACIHNIVVRRDERFYLFARADSVNVPIAHEHRAVCDDGKLTHQCSRSRAPLRTGERHELRTVDDSVRLGHRKFQVSSFKFQVPRRLFS